MIVSVLPTGIGAVSGSDAGSRSRFSPAPDPAPSLYSPHAASPCRQEGQAQGPESRLPHPGLCCASGGRAIHWGGGGGQETILPWPLRPVRGLSSAQDFLPIPRPSMRHCLKWGGGFSEPPVLRELNLVLFSTLILDSEICVQVCHLGAWCDAEAGCD